MPTLRSLQDPPTGLPGSVRVLLVDDDEDEFLLTQRRLARSDDARYALEWVADYDAALEMMARNQHDVYLVDYRLGPRSGLDLLRSALEQGCTAPVIVLTGQGEYSVDVEAMKAGAADFLVKGELEPRLLERSIRYAVERKRAESELRRAQEQLEQAARAQLEFMTLVAHDLKAPLTVIAGRAQFLQRQMRQLPPADTQRFSGALSQIDATAHKLAILIDHLLDAARLEHGQALQLQLGPTDLVALVREIANQQQAQNTGYGVVIEATVPELVGQWDRFRLERVIDNLLANAIKYSPPGSDVTLRVASAVDASGTWAVLEVWDAGIGIPTDDLPHVFERYYRARNAGGRARGMGIGLAGVAQIVQQHGGTIGVESQEGAGSTFTVRLPLAPPDSQGT